MASQVDRQALLVACANLETMKTNASSGRSMHFALHDKQPYHIAWASSEYARQLEMALRGLNRDVAQLTNEIKTLEAASEGGRSQAMPRRAGVRSISSTPSSSVNDGNRVTKANNAKSAVAAKERRLDDAKKKLAQLILLRDRATRAIDTKAWVQDLQPLHARADPRHTQGR